MDLQRYFCSQLVTLTSKGGSRVANLEEIWQTGCVLEAEGPVPLEGRAEIRWAGVMLAGRLTEASEHEFGWRLRMDFSPLTPWSRDVGEPAHLLDLPDL